MDSLYAYSVLPVAAISLLLFFTVALRHRGPWGVAAYCGATGLWALNLLFAHTPSATLSEFGLRMSAVGAFVVAGYLHAAYDLTDQKRYGLVWFAYAVALVITVAGALIPGLLYDPNSLAAGPMFWPAMVLAIVASSVPFWHLIRHYRQAESGRRRPLLFLFAAGLVGYLGAWSNALLLAHGQVLPYGLFFVLASLLMLAALVQAIEPEADRRLFERSLIYSALAALLSAGFLFGALVFLADPATPLLRDFGPGALFLLCMAALAFEPVRQQLQEWLGRHLSKDRAQAGDLARELALQEARAHQAEKMAELGSFTSAIAHEVRNPLGVLSAHLTMLERKGVDSQTIDEMRDQIDRASHFLDDLLQYGRPRHLELRMVRLWDTLELAYSQAMAALREEVDGEVEFDCSAEPQNLTIEADQAQLMQVFVILLENALLAIADDDEAKISARATESDDQVVITIADSGPGIDDAVTDRLFDPFVTSRKREGRRQGTGLGLAIARGIIDRHGGTIDTCNGPLEGATFRIVLPRHQPVLAAATATAAKLGES